MPPVAAAEENARRERIARFDGEYAFLSNFHPAPLRYGGLTWLTVEHAFQAYKTTDQAIRLRIYSLPTPGEAKKAGRSLALRPDWDEIRKQVMLDLLIAKFRHQGTLAARLSATGSRLLVEGNTWHDQFWGSCECGREACRVAGLNYLGRLLMAVRLTYLPDEASR
jgi:ribA/ribD-fused uncharacterized protein